MNILVFAPHADDEVLGCGGTIAKYAEMGHDIYVAVVTSGMEPLFTKESNEVDQKNCLAADKCVGVKKTIFMGYPAAMLENVPRHEINASFLNLVKQIKPEIVFIPHRGDMQLDHKLVVDAAMVALRPKYEHVVKKILMYETLSETGWDVPNDTNAFIPNYYEDISAYLNKKVEALSVFEGQIETFPSARSTDGIISLAKYRGCMMGMNAAEAFCLIRELN